MNRSTSARPSPLFLCFCLSVTHYSRYPRIFVVRVPNTVSWRWGASKVTSVSVLTGVICPNCLNQPTLRPPRRTGLRVWTHTPLPHYPLRLSRHEQLSPHLRRGTNGLLKVGPRTVFSLHVKSFRSARRHFSY